VVVYCMRLTRETLFRFRLLQVRGKGVVSFRLRGSHELGAWEMKYAANDVAAMGSRRV
jgi:hypothetical protein